jgi:hypothetical protein
MVKTELNKVHVAKLVRITEELIPRFDNELNADIWNHYAQNYNLIIFLFSKETDDERWHAERSDGSEITNGELNAVLNQIIDRQSKQQHIPRPRPSDGGKIKTESISTVSNDVKPADVEEYLKILEPLKLPLNVKMFLYNINAQYVQEAYQGKTKDEQFYAMKLQEMRYRQMADIYYDLHKEQKIKAIHKIIEIHNAPAVKISRAKRKAEKAQNKLEAQNKSKENKVGRPKKIEEKLTPIQFLMKAAKLDYNNPVAVSEYTARYNALTGENQPSFKFTTTSETTESFGKDKN